MTPALRSQNCTHYACRCARANELAIMAERSGRNDLLFEALKVHEQEVLCRQPSATRGGEGQMSNDSASRGAAGERDGK